jgi:uncharacterized protein (TIGR03437 family)
VAYSVAANGGLGRSATISIAGLAFTINQLAAQPSISEGGILNAASYQPGFASGTWVMIKGDHLATTTRTWTDSDFAADRLPELLDGVRVDINGKPAYVYYVSPAQLDVLAPEDFTEGPVQVDVTNILGRASATANKLTVAPAFFTVATGSKRYVVASFADGILLLLCYKRFWEDRG